jgi:RNA polymerase sigma-70 factor (ECF subfamily)
MRDWRPAVAGAQQGSLAAFDQLVRRFQHMAVGYAYSIPGDFQLAEDAAQEAFVQACQSASKSDPPSASRTDPPGGIPQCRRQAL